MRAYKRAHPHHANGAVSWQTRRLHTVSTINPRFRPPCPKVTKHNCNAENESRLERTHIQQHLPSANAESDCNPENSIPSLSITDPITNLREPSTSILPQRVTQYQPGSKRLCNPRRSTYQQRESLRNVS